MRKTVIIRKASDGTVFENAIDLARHESKLTQLRLQWYNKRFSICGEIKYFLFRVEPKKPYKF